jgi:hypothetical protein
MTNVINPDILKQKLKRHKLSFTYNDVNNTLVLGGIDNLVGRWIVSVILPLSFALIVFILAWFELIPLFDKGRGVAKIIGFLIGVPVVLSIVGLARIILKKKRNADEKTISPQGVVIKNKMGSTITLTGSQIKEFNYSISTDSSMSIAKLHLLTHEGREFTILGAESNQFKYLKDDMEYFKTYFEKVIKI